MLYSFHKTQTAKNPNSVHATYLVSGIKKSDALAAGGTKGKDGEDTVMDSSPFPSSWAETPDRPEPKIVKTITLVKEENLEGLDGTHSKLPKGVMLTIDRAKG
jgi:DNA polymerase delta subunit 3